jgi:adenylate cyclase
MSYETFSLVQDEVTARPMAPISLKGISREIVPYAVEEIIGKKDVSNSRVIEARANGMNLFLDIDAIDGASRMEIEGALKSALSAVQSVQNK